MPNFHNWYLVLSDLLAAACICTYKQKHDANPISSYARNRRLDPVQEKKAATEGREGGRQGGGWGWGWAVMIHVDLEGGWA